MYFALVIIAYIAVEVLLKTGSLGSMFSSLLVPITCYVVAAIGLNLNVGISGELNLGQAGFMSVGAFFGICVSGILANSISAGIPRLIIAIFCGAILAAVFGFLIGIPVLKLQGDYLAIVTLAFGQIIKSIFMNAYIGIDTEGLHFSFVESNFKLQPGGKMLLNGPMGATGTQKIANFTVGTVLVIVALLVVYNLMFSRSGRAIMAARDNRIAAESVGIPISRTKMLAFVTSAALAGAAGALYGLNYSTLVPNKFDFNTSILILVYVVLGGLGNMTGTINGRACFQARRKEVLNMADNADKNVKAPVLDVQELGIDFGGLTAVNDLNMQVYDGEIVGLIGPNGAGKTTVFNLLTKVYKPTRGKIYFDGKDTAGKSVVDINKAGIARTFQNIRLFGNLTVLDNVKTGFHNVIPYSPITAILRLPKYFASEKEINEKAMDLLKIMELDKYADYKASNLPYGAQRRLEIARALATNPKLLLLDEPAAGMNPQETAELMDMIRFVRDHFKIAVLLIEHDMKLVMGICERITVLNYGMMLAQGTPEEIQSNPEVIKAYLGD